MSRQSDLDQLYSLLMDLEAEVGGNSDYKIVQAIWTGRSEMCIPSLQTTKHETQPTSFVLPALERMLYLRTLERHCGIVYGPIAARKGVV